jgi:hypothetical protein
MAHARGAWLVTSSQGTFLIRSGKEQTHAPFRSSIHAWLVVDPRAVAAVKKKRRTPPWRRAQFVRSHFAK